jgi:hypothetical protein
MKKCEFIKKQKLGENGGELFSFPLTLRTIEHFKTAVSSLNKRGF